MKRHVSFIAAVLCALWLTHPARAYSTLGARWPSGASVVMHLQLGSSPTLMDGSPNWNAVAEDALGEWNPLLGSVAFRVMRESGSSISLGNGINNVSWGDTIYGESFGENVIAVAPYRYYTSDNRFAETDVVFNRAYNWNSYRGNLRSAPGGGTLLDFHRVALHEFGHALGLDHPDKHEQSVTAIMNSRISNSDVLQSDDINGARAVYSSSGAPAPPRITPRDTMRQDDRLLVGQSLVSSNGRYRLTYQGDGNLVLFDEVDRVPVWGSGTGETSTGYVLMQSDGNLVIYDAQIAGRWGTGTAGNPDARVTLQNDGNLVLYRADGFPLWGTR